MISSSFPQLRNTQTVPPAPKTSISLEFPNGSIAYIWNKTAWIVEKTGKVFYEFRASAPLSSVAFNGEDLFAVGDSKGVVRVFSYSPTNMQQKPVVEGQVLNTDISGLKFVRKDIIAAGGGNGNSTCRTFMTIFKLETEFKVICDGTGGPTKAVNDVACSGDLIAFASDDRSVTLFELRDKTATFLHSFTDYGGLVGKVLFSDDRQHIAYGSGGSSGRFIIRKLDEESATESIVPSSTSGRLLLSGKELKSEIYSNANNGTKGIIKKVISNKNALQAYDHVGTLVYTLESDAILGGNDVQNDTLKASFDGRRISVKNKSTDVAIRTSGWASHTSSITSIAFFSDTQLVSVGLDGHLFVWDINIPLKPLAAALNAHHGPISSLAISENTIITFGQEDASIRFFELPL